MKALEKARTSSSVFNMDRHVIERTYVVMVDIVLDTFLPWSDDSHLGQSALREIMTGVQDANLRGRQRVPVDGDKLLVLGRPNIDKYTIVIFLKDQDVVLLRGPNLMCPDLIGPQDICRFGIVDRLVVVAPHKVKHVLQDFVEWLRAVEVPEME